jgi:hypothetical protein
MLSISTPGKAQTYEVVAGDRGKRQRKSDSMRITRFNCCSLRNYCDNIRDRGASALICRSDPRITVRTIQQLINFGFDTLQCRRVGFLSGMLAVTLRKAAG